MTFDEIMYELFKQTNELEVIATGWWHDGKHDLGIRSGNAALGAPFHDPIIDEHVFMIAGDLYTNDWKRFKNLKEIMEEFQKGINARIRVQTIAGPMAIDFDIGAYTVESIELLHDSRIYEYCAFKLKLKRQ